MKPTFRAIEPWPGVSPSDWNSWTWQFRHSLSTAEDFGARFDLTDSEREAFSRAPNFQVRSTPYYAALADSRDARDPVRQMLLPRVEEWSPSGQHLVDPLGERRHSPTDRLVHRYPDRVLFLVTDQCALYCRYCLRKHFTGQDQAFVGSAEYLRALDYLRRSTGIREVILSGGDPLTVSDARLRRVLEDLRSIDHVEIIRLATRIPVVCPQRVTEDLVKLLREFKPVFLMTHFNHPRELTAASAEALERFVDHGIPAFNQMVLLRGINADAETVRALSRQLLYLRVKPYYMFQCDPSQGSDHFRTSVDESMAIQRELWGRLSGLAMPNLSLDIPGGGGKVGLTPNFEVARTEHGRVYTGWDGITGEYVDPSPN